MNQILSADGEASVTDIMGVQLSNLFDLCVKMWFNFLIVVFLLKFLYLVDCCIMIMWFPGRLHFYAIQRMAETAAVGSLTQSVPSLATELVTYSRILRFGIHAFVLFYTVRSPH